MLLKKPYPLKNPTSPTIFPTKTSKFARKLTNRFQKFSRRGIFEFVSKKTLKQPKGKIFRKGQKQ